MQIRRRGVDLAAWRSFEGDIIGCNIPVTAHQNSIKMEMDLPDSGHGASMAIHFVALLKSDDVRPQFSMLSALSGQTRVVRGQGRG